MRKEKRDIMKRRNDIRINRFQLNILLDTEESNSYYDLLDHGVYCTNCMDTCENGVNVTEIYLDKLNDIKVMGICKKCGGGVTRIMEFGESPEFSLKADKFRKSTNNQ